VSKELKPRIKSEVEKVLKENRPVDGRLHRGEDGEDQKGLTPELGYQGDREGNQEQAGGAC